MGSLPQMQAGRHEYALKAGQKVMLFFFAAMLFVLSLLFLRVIGAAAHGPGLGIALLGGLPSLAASVFLAATALRSRLILDGNQVIVRSAFRERSCEMSQIEGYRTVSSRYGRYRVLCLKDGARQIALAQYAGDDDLDRWFQDVTDLDKRDRDVLLQQIEGDQELGATPEERRSALSRAKVIDVAACVVILAAAAALLFGPKKYRSIDATVLMLGPVLAILLLYRSPLLYSLFKARNDPRAELSPLILISGFGLFLGLKGAHIVSFQSLLLEMGLVVAACLAALTPALRRSPRFVNSLIGSAVFCLIYAWGAVATANTVWDRSPAQLFHVAVVGGHVTHGKSTTYFLELEPWGPYPRVNSLSVPRQVYYASRQGDMACVELHAGALHAPWYERVDCAGEE